MNELTQPISTGKLAAGLVLLLVGLLALADSLDFVDARDIWRLWPVLLIFLGAAKEVDVLRGRSRENGYILLAVGVWMLAATQHFLGLDYRTAFPLGVIVAGLGIIAHSILGISRETRREQH